MSLNVAASGGGSDAAAALKQRAMFMSNGSFLPLVTDKVRNNVRVRGHLIAIYTLIAAVVSVIIILTITPVESVKWTASFAAPPSVQFSIGTTLEPFSFQVKNDANVGVAGLYVETIFLPIDAFELEVAVQSEAVESRTVNCLQTIVMRNSTYFYEDAVLCVPNTCNATTDDTGLAVFTDCTISFGAAVTYIAFAFVEGHEDLVGYAFAAAEIDIASAAVTDSTLGDNLTINNAFSVTVTAELSSRQPPTKLSAVILTLELGGASWVPFTFSNDLPSHTGIFLTSTTEGGSISSTSHFVPKENDRDVYRCNFTFSDVLLHAASSPRLYIGIIVGGNFIIPLSSQPWNAVGQSPQQLVYPFPVKPAADVVTVTARDTLAGNAPTIMEATAFTLDIQSSASFIYVMGRPSVRNPSTNFSALEHPQQNSKRLWFNVLMSDGSGFFTTRNTTFFSASGAVGYYDLFVVADGVVGTWGSSGAVMLTVLVTSSVGNCRVDDPGDNSIVTAGERWDILPSVTITNARGHALPGKHAQLRATTTTDGTNNAVVVSYSSPSEDDGVSSFSAVVAGYASVTTRITRTFAVVVDGVTVGTVRRQFEPTLGLDGEQCSFVSFASFPVDATPSGTSAVVKMQALTATGAPAGYSLLSFYDKEQEAFLFESAVSTDGDGFYELRVEAEFAGISSSLLQVQCASEIPSFISSAAVIVFRARIKSTSASFSEGKLTVDFDADWNAVSSNSPVSVSAEIVWLPTYAAYYRQQELPACVSATITDPSELPVTLPCSAGAAAGFYVFVPVVDHITVLPALSTLLPSRVASLRISTSAFASPGERPFASQQPVVEVQDAAGGLIENVTVYAILLSRPASSSGPFAAQLMFDRPESLAAGGILRDRGDVVFFAASNPSNVQGLAAFDSIVITTVAENTEISIRYCTTNDAFGIPDVCIDESETYQFSVGDVCSLRTLITEVLGTPGARLSNSIGITAAVGDPPAPVRALLCTAYVTPVNSSTVLESFLRFEGASFGRIFASETNKVTMDLRVSATSRPGQYSLHLVCPGTSLTLPIGVTKQAINVNLARPPADVVRVGTTFSFLATVLSVGPLAGAYIEARFQPGNESTCTNLGCGVLSEASTVVAKTNRRGQATFFLNFQYADSGPFVFSLTVRDSLSPSSARSSMITGIGEITNIFGLSRKALLQTLDPASDVYGSLSRLYTSIDTIGQGAAEKADSQSKSAFLRFLGVAQDPVGTTIDIEVYNPVATIHVVRDGSFDLVLDAVSIRGLPVPRTSKTVTEAEAVILLLLDVDGRPVVNASVEISVLPLGSPSALRIAYPTGLMSNGTGHCIVYPFVLSTNVPGTYSLLYASNGGASVTSKSIQVTSKPPLSLSEAMKYASFLVLAFFSPMLLGTVPHSRPWYLALSLGANVAALIAILSAGISYGPDFFPTNDYVKGYFVFVYCLTCAITVATVGVVALYFSAYVSGKSKFRFLNDEGRALRIFKYAVWITNVRVAKQKPKPIPPTLLERVKGLVSSSPGDRRTANAPAEMAKEKESTTAALQDPLLGANPPLTTCKQTPANDGPRTPSPDRKPMYRPEDPVLQYDGAPDPSSIPLDYLIVLGISVIMMILISLYTIYIFKFLEGQMSTLLSYLPVIRDSVAIANQGAAQVTGIAGTDVNQVLSNLLGQVLEMVSMKFPQLSSLATASVSLQNVDLTSYLNTIQKAAEEISNGFTVSFWIAFSTAIVVFIVNALSTVLRIPSMSADIRRQKLVVTTTIGNSQGYIGVHCIHFIAMQQIAFWIVFIVVLLLKVSFIRVFIWEKAKVIIIAMFSMSLLIKILQSVLVNKILTFGNFTVIRPEMYAIWDFFAIIIGIFEGIRVSISRLVTAFVLVIVLFAKLDVALYPPIFARSDKAHANFLAIVNTETKNSNPLFLLMCTILLVNRELRQKKLAGQTLVSADSLFEGERNLSACVINLARIYGRFLCGERQDEGLALHHASTPERSCLSLSLVDDPRAARWNKTVLRFRLLLLLHRHPSLQRHRKNYLYNGPAATRTAKSTLLVAVTCPPPPQVLSATGGDPLSRGDVEMKNLNSERSPPRKESDDVDDDL